MNTAAKISEGLTILNRYSLAYVTTEDGYIKAGLADPDKMRPYEVRQLLEMGWQFNAHGEWKHPA